MMNDRKQNEFGKSSKAARVKKKAAFCCDQQFREKR